MWEGLGKPPETWLVTLKGLHWAQENLGPVETVA